MVVHRALGMSSLAEVGDRSLLRDSKAATGCSWSARYGGAVPWRQRKMSTASLNWMRSGTDNQCSSLSSGVQCLSNAMHGHNINLPVCVCVFVTLSVNSPTGQTPQRNTAKTSNDFCNSRLVGQPSATAAQAWNSLPPETQACSSLVTFGGRPRLTQRHPSHFCQS